MPELRNSDATLAQFNRLLRELLGEGLHRHTFRPWEIEILLDLESSDLKDPQRGTILRRYQKVVQRMMEQGARMPLRFAQYMEMVQAGGTPPRKPAASQLPKSSSKQESNRKPNQGLKIVPPREKKSRPGREHFARGFTVSSFFPLGREK
jgi:hypothetical protein